MPSEEEDDNDVEEEEDDIIDEEEKEEEEAEEMLTPVKAKFSKKRLLKIAIRFYKTLLYTANFERYHKCYFCPLPGCPSTRAIKKLSNHLVQVHRIHDRRERAKVLKQAKDIGPQAPQRRKVNITINEAFSRVRQRSSYLVEPKIQERQRHHP